MLAMKGVVLSADLGHLGQSGNQHRCHFRAAVISGRKIEFPYRQAKADG